MKTLSTALQSHIATNTLTLATCWKLTRKDGTDLFFTDHDTDIIFSGDTYKASTGFNPSNIDVKGELSVSNLDVYGPFGTLASIDIRESDLLAGLYDEAEIEIFLVNYDSPSDGNIKLIKGYIGEITRHRDAFTAEIRSLNHLLQQEIGDVYTPYCRVDLFSTKCGLNSASYIESGTVTSVTNNKNFASSGSTNITSQSNDYFNLGKLTWTGGDNSGLIMEVKDFTASGGSFSLVEPMPYNISNGDTFTVLPGCDKSLATCKTKFNNVVNFRGEPYVPGEDYLMTYPDSK